MKRILFIAAVICVLPQTVAATTIYLTSGTTWNVPSDWNNSSNTIEAIGAGGTGPAGSPARGGGGGGAYAKAVNVSLEGQAQYQIGVGGGTTGAGTSPTANSWFKNASTLVAAGGASGTTAGGGAGGSASNSVGAVVFSGGNGGFHNSSGYNLGAGGGAAAGQNGAGGSGGNGVYNSLPGGGGGANGGTNGGTGSAGVGASGGGNGGLGRFSGTFPGGNGTNFNATHGSGGGGGGGLWSAPGSGGLYGGGGGSSINGTGLGAPGLIIITYTPASTACTLTLAPSSVAYGSGSTLTYSSTNATQFSITNVGYVTPNTSASTQVYTAGSYTGQAKGPDGVWRNCSPNGGALTVTAPEEPSADLASSEGTTMELGETSTITATFSVDADDTLTAANIDQPLGTGRAANTNPGTKTYSFTPTTAGTYTFYARATSEYFTSWTTYDTLTITVTAPCTLNGITLQHGESHTFYSSQTAPLGGTCGSVSQTRTCSDGVLSGSASYQFGSCACAPTYSCTGQQVTFTNSLCETSIVTTCTAPSFCSPGVSACVYNPPVFAPDGHLRADPALVRPGETTTLSWDVDNVESCAVTGTNGDSWSTTSTNGVTTASLITSTIYTLTCEGDDGSELTETLRVNVIPIFQEN